MRIDPTTRAIQFDEKDVLEFAKQTVQADESKGLVPMYEFSIDDLNLWLRAEKLRKKQTVELKSSKDFRAMFEVGDVFKGWINTIGIITAIGKDRFLYVRMSGEECVSAIYNPTAKFRRIYKQEYGMMVEIAKELDIRINEWKD
jgi:phage anti-repressor protein